jgi:hypothetical protein
MPTKTNYESPLQNSSLGAGIGTVLGGTAGFLIGGPLGAKIGMAGGQAIGQGIGGHIEKKKLEEEQKALEDQQVIGQNMSSAQQQFMKNQAMYGAVEDEMYPNQDMVMGGSPVKMLKSIPYTEPKNMSALQYKSSLKMKEISGVNTLPS